MRRMIFLSLVITAACITGCATSDAGQFRRTDASGGCEVGTGGFGQPPCKMVYWSSRDGMVDPHEQDSNSALEPKND